ncbi:MAG: caspase family protein [Myxococcota bacterium]
MRRLAPILAMALALAPLPARAAAERKLALIVANHEGGPGTVRLRYARADAEKVASVLTELGGVTSEDLLAIYDEDADAVRAALRRVEAKIAEAGRGGQRTTLLFYYSGHAKDGALLLGRSRLPMNELKSALQRSQADVRLGIIDACQSGAITRSKGGRQAPSFLFDADDKDAARGMVLVSSSSADEDSQESDEIGGSYFTQYLTSGLRGDADESGDRRVTLSEVYAYAYNKTVRETVETRAGVQHPTYSYDLEGSGGLVLTDLTAGLSGLSFPMDLEGEFLVFDLSRDQVAAEIKKVAGTPRRLALPAGSYVLKRRLRDHLEMQRFSLGARGDVIVDALAMENVAFEDDYAKGGRDLLEETPRFGFGLKILAQSFLSDSAQNALFPSLFLLGGSIGLDHVLGAKVSVDVLAGGRGHQGLVLPNLELPYNFFELETAAEMIWALGDDRWAMLLGPRLAGIYVRRTFPEDPILSAHVQDHFGLAPTAVVGLRYGLDRGGHFAVELRGHLGVYFFSVDKTDAFAFAEGSLWLGYTP